MFRITGFRLAIVGLVVLGALFVDGFSLVPNANIAGRAITVHKGLDLQGGTELVLAVCRGPNDPPGADCRNGPPNGASVSSAQQSTLPIIQQRVNALGVSEAVVQAQGDDQILVQLPGVSLDEAKAAVGTTAKLYFATPVAGAPPTAQQLAHPDQATRNFIADQQNHYNPAQFGDTLYYPADYHWKIDNNIDASDVQSADVGTDSLGNIAVDITFNGHGASEWEKITNAAFAAYETNTTNPPPQAFIAIFLDNDVLTAPVVQQGGQSNQTQITGGFSTTSAQQLANDINAGALPAEIGTVQTTEVSATLGSQTVQSSIVAGAVGLLIVIIFMIGYYRFPGLLATLALLIYAAIVFALFMLIPVTLSLAGLAGFVLSVGMAVDANVLIFERTRDELRHGRGVALAVETGFRRAFPAIRDSNISTIIACLVLFAFGTSVVRGFALTLGIGVIVSFFTAITVTRSLFAWVLRWRIGRNPTLYTQIHEEYEERPPGDGSTSCARATGTSPGLWRSSSPGSWRSSSGASTWGSTSAAATASTCTWPIRPRRRR